jgi:hypothetical protein
MEHRGVRYEIKIALGKNRWTWIVHTSPKSRQGSIEGPRRDAVAAAEKVIDKWWKQRYGSSATRVTEESGRTRPQSD